MEKLLVTLDVNCTDCLSVETKGKTVRLVLFDGTASGDFFHGKILPGGVDTQTVDADGRGHLSARYILEGKDDRGQACRIFVDNEAEMGSTRTKPTIVTDSQSLKWLMDADLYGTIDDSDGLKIRIYCRD